MPPTIFAPSAKPLSGRCLSFAEREELAIPPAQGLGVREAARRLGRAASTISRELRRKAATRSGKLEYRASTAHKRSGARRKCVMADEGLKHAAAALRQRVTALASVVGVPTAALCRVGLMMEEPEAPLAAGLADAEWDRVAALQKVALAAARADRGRAA